MVHPGIRLLVQQAVTYCKRSWSEMYKWERILLVVGIGLNVVIYAKYYVPKWFSILAR